MIQQYKCGKTKHLFVLKGLVQLVPGGRAHLKFRGGEHAATVFEAYRATGDRWAIRYRHPLSAFQAFNVAIAILHNPISQALDMLPPLDEVPQAPDPELSIYLTPTERLEHAYSVAYCLCVYGSRIFCGTHSGHIQQWQCPIGAPATVIEWRGHSGTVYALAVAGRSIVSASRDWLLRVWDLQTLTLVATLPGHRASVRCMCCSTAAPSLIYSGANDKTVRVWDVATLSGGDHKRGQVLRGHRSWVRAIVCSSSGDRVCSAAKDIRIWSTETLQLLQLLPVGHRIYSLGMCRVSDGRAMMDTIYAGCNKGKIRSWQLGQVTTKDCASTGEIALPQDCRVRAIAIQGHILLCGDHSGGMRAYDLSTLPMRFKILDGHRAGIRAIGVDTLSNTVFSASDGTS